MADPIVFWIDSAKNRLAAGWNQFIFAPNPSFKQGDTLDVILRWVKRPTIGNTSMEEISWEGQTVSFEVGNIGWKPVAGKWYMNFESESTELIDYNASAEDVETALNSTSSILEAGGVSVTQASSDGYKIVFVDNGTRTAPSGSGEPLIPTSNVVVNTVTLGSATTKAVFWVTLRQTIVTEEVGDWESEETCTADVQSIKPDIWDIYLTSQPQDGSFIISIDEEEPVIISVFDDAQTIEDIIGDGFSVSKQGDYRWRIKNDSEDPFTVTVEDDSNIVSFNGIKNKILFDDVLVSEMLNGSSLSSAMLQISVQKNGNRSTILSTSCTITSRVTQ
jgi:hypothetical protein